MRGTSNGVSNLMETVSPVTVDDESSVEDFSVLKDWIPQDPTDVEVW